MQARRHTNNGERGSAMLIVLVLAAIIAIMLYKELPVSAFEKQRQNEELVVARGDQYKRAVKLFVRKFGRFPSTIAELESTNRMRFLRQKYADPLTGKDDWRLIHAGPGGIILDSKVNNTTGKPGSNALGQGATFGGFNNSIVQPDANADQPGISAAALRQRAPAVSSSGAGGSPGAGGGSSDFPPMPGTGESPMPGVGNGQGLYPGLAAPGADGTNASQNAAQGYGQTNGQSPAALSGGGLGNNPNGAGSGIGTAGPGNSSVTQQLGTQNPATPQTAGAAATSAFPQNANAQQAGQGLAAGGIAGVAVPLTVAGKSIKTVNDQKKYSLWEFYYDLKKDQTGNAAGALQQGQNGAVGQNGLNNQNNGTNGFGSGSSFGSNGSSSFGNSSSFGSSQPTNGQSGSAPVNGQLPVTTPPQE
jgi:hypothetical protein